MHRTWIVAGAGSMALVALAACAGAASATPVRRVVVDPADAGYEQADCEQRCASHLKPGEHVRCEHARFDSETGDALGTSFGLVCIIGEPHEAPP